MSKKNIADEYMENAQGHLVPIDAIDEFDLARDELVRELVAEAERVHDLLAEFKLKAMQDVEAFVELSGERYDVSIGGTKGNVSLTSFDGSYQVKVQISDRIVFDERIHAARAIIDECIQEWSKDSKKEVRALIQHAFQTDKEGKLSVSRILGLTRLKIEDERWQQAMQAIKDSAQVASSKSYLRVYKRDDTGDYQKMNLDIASI